MKLADTSFPFDLLIGMPGAVRKAKAIQEDGTVLLVPARCVADLLRGVLWGGGTGLDAAEALLAELAVAPLDERAARRAGSVSAEASDRGAEVGMMDGLISGIALETDAEIISRGSDFQRVSCLRVETY